MGSGISGSDFSGTSPSSLKTSVDPSATLTGRSPNDPTNFTAAKIRISAASPETTTPTTNPITKFFMVAPFSRCPARADVFVFSAGRQAPVRLLLTVQNQIEAAAHVGKVLFAPAIQLYGGRSLIANFPQRPVHF